MFIPVITVRCERLSNNGLRFTRVHTGQVFLTRPGDDSRAVRDQVAFFQLGQTLIAHSGQAIHNTIILEIANWESFRAAHDVRETYQINGEWQPIREW